MSEGISNSAMEPLRPHSGPFYFSISSTNSPATCPPWPPSMESAAPCLQRLP